MNNQLKKVKISSSALLIGLFLLFLFAAVSLAAVQTEQSNKAVETCGACHEEQVKAFASNRHAVIDGRGLAKKAKAEFSCTSCHGDPAKHLEQGGGQGTIFAFAKTELANAKTKACLACHADNHGGFLASAHAKTAMDCTSCHSVHAKAEANSHAGASCKSCHADVAAKFKLNERHRLKEGIMDCTACHNPHEASNRERLGGFKQQECFKCHTDKQGPFVFEHGAGTYEGCTVCHEPHGSTNRHLLTFQNVSDLCFSCHANRPTLHNRMTKDTRCTNCHSAIHGSNLSNIFFK